MIEILQVWHADLAEDQVSGLRRLFDQEYLADFGEWTPDAPYGYSSADLHTFGVGADGRIVGHVGTQRRRVRVGDESVTVAGTGGVLVCQSKRGAGLGSRLVKAAQHASRTTAPADFGYLGCREEVVPFYLACGYTRIRRTEIHVPRLDHTSIVTEADALVLICAGTRGVDMWPSGTVDLCGTPW